MLYWDLIGNLLQFSLILSIMSVSGRLVSLGMAKFSSIPSLMVAAGTGGGGFFVFALTEGDSGARIRFSFTVGNLRGGGSGLLFILK